MEIKPFKIRCSAIGQIMTNPRSKTELLSETTKKYCKTWLLEQIFNRRKEFSNKYTEKGIQNEDEGLDFIAKMLNYGMLIKNDEFYYNDFIEGTPDALLPILVIDDKNSWDCFTFPLLETEIPNIDYYYQLQGYMELTGKKQAKLIYTLTDTPEHLIERECRNWCYKNGYDLDLDIFNEFKSKMTYPDIEDRFKIKIFDIDYDENIIKSIFERVVLCRNYIETLIFNLKIKI